MAKYPTSCLDGSAAHAFGAVLGMHLEGRRVLDVTYGDGLSWGEGDMFDNTRVYSPRFGPIDVDLTKSDIKPPYAQDLFALVRTRPEWAGVFDLLYYDPPWFIDIEGNSDDPRAEAYGGYGQQTCSLDRYVDAVRDLAVHLRVGGKIVVKCSDQYHVPSRRLLLHHLQWCASVRCWYDLVDFYVYRFHRVSPTAYQVKDRPCAVVSHSYFIVGQKRG